MTGAGPSPEPATDLSPVLDALAQVKRDREGVAMFLVLEDLATDGEPAAAAGPAADGPALAELAGGYAERLHLPAEPTERQAAAVLELLAALHFTEARR